VAKDNEPGLSDSLLAVIILARVFVILVVWLALFLAMFLGYFTVPILLVGGVMLVYGLFDIGLYVVLKKQKQLHEPRRNFLRMQSQAKKPDEER
jgi:predicted DNA repair protein MutK